MSRLELPQRLEGSKHDELGARLHEFAAELFPICRSITGEGVRKSLDLIGKQIPIQVQSVPTGSRVLDWTVPREWNIRDAYIRRPNGPRLVDFRLSNLHVLNYSTPVHQVMTLDELRPHLFTLPDRPDWIPYRTSYYREDWGFCLAHRQMMSLEDGEYEVVIDSSLQDGLLNYGEAFFPGSSSEEILVSCHICHPSLANDNLSGVTVSVFLASLVAAAQLRYSYRFLFVPGTIGAITWLAQNRDSVNRIRHGLVLTCLGDAGGFHYKRSRRSTAEIDRIVEQVLRHSKENFEILDFSPYGYDERQYCSPGFNLPVGCLMRSTWGSFPEYHTSADNLEFLRPESLSSSLELCIDIVNALEGNRRYENLMPFGEPQLGKRNLYPSQGGASHGTEVSAMLWMLNFSDGNHSVLDIAERSGLPVDTLAHAANRLETNGLLREIST